MPLTDDDYYIDEEADRVILKESFLLKRGYCCNGICRHCPYKKVKMRTPNSDLVNLINHTIANTKFLVPDKYKSIGDAIISLIEKEDLFIGEVPLFLIEEINDIIDSNNSKGVLWLTQISVAKLIEDLFIAKGLV